MKKILFSVASIGLIVGLGVAATGAFFSDTETSTGNTFQAGAIDLTVDSEAHYDGLVCDESGKWVQEGNVPTSRPDLLGELCDGYWTLTDLNQSHKFFNLSDLKPGDDGENTISLHITSNPSYACVNIIPTLNDDVTTNEPELEAGDVANTDSIFDGELAQNMHFSIWADVCDTQDVNPGDNIYQAGCDIPLTDGDGPITPTTWALASPGLNVFGGTDPLLAETPYYIGVAWDIPTSVGNNIQTDKYMADISFYVEQARNNPNFVCPVISTPPEEHKLVLENETIVVGGPWTIIPDGTDGLLTWTGDGNTFDYTLTAKGLTPVTDYALVYYADGWPGNNPGAFIGEGTTDGSGALVFNGTPNLGIDLPMPADGNYAIGAKVWLVLSADYNNGNPTTGPMTAWQPDKYLFEGNVYIHYNDLDN